MFPESIQEWKTERTARPVSAGDRNRSEPEADAQHGPAAGQKTERPDTDVAQNRQSLYKVLRNRHKALCGSVARHQKAPVPEVDH